MANSKQSFAFGCSTAVFPDEEIEALTKSGARLEAMAAGRIPPATPADRHFLLVHREEAEPRTVAERAWVRLLARREFEQGDRARPPLEPPTDYGMVEFDKDRCWW